MTPPCAPGSPQHRHPSQWRAIRTASWRIPPASRPCPPASSSIAPARRDSATTGFCWPIAPQSGAAFWPSSTSVELAVERAPGLRRSSIAMVVGCVVNEQAMLRLLQPASKEHTRYGVIVATFEQPAWLDLCLRAWNRQVASPSQILVADDRRGPETATVIPRQGAVPVRPDRPGNRLGKCAAVNRAVERAPQLSFEY